MRFPYQAADPRPAALAALVLIIAGVLVPLPLFKAILLSFAAGPGAWALLQWQRRGHGLTLGNKEVVIERSFARSQRIPYTMIRGFAATPRDSLVLAIEDAQKAAVQDQTTLR